MKRKVLREIFEKLDPKNFGVLNSKNLDLKSLSSFDLIKVENFVVEIFKNPELFVTFDVFCDLCM